MLVFERFKLIKAFAFDVDGVFTDGDILVNDSGEQLRKFNVKDGYAVQLAVKAGYPILIVSGGKSISVKVRLEGLGVNEVHLNVSDKVAVLNDWIKGLGLKHSDVLYMGDDVPDLAAMKSVGFPTCPSDAIQDIKEICFYISPREGGKGAVRDVIEKVMRLQGTWDNVSTIKSI